MISLQKSSNYILILLTTRHTSFRVDMGNILLAIWDNEASLQAQDTAIKLAQENNDDLLFLYIVNIDFLRHTTHPVHPNMIKNELNKLG